jgi:hypothetical protein
VNLRLETGIEYIWLPTSILNKRNMPGDTLSEPHSKRQKYIRCDHRRIGYQRRMGSQRTLRKGIESIVARAWKKCGTSYYPTANKEPRGNLRTVMSLSADKKDHAYKAGIFLTAKTTNIFTSTMHRILTTRSTGLIGCEVILLAAGLCYGAVPVIAGAIMNLKRT